MNRQNYNKFKASRSSFFVVLAVVINLLKNYRREEHRSVTVKCISVS